MRRPARRDNDLLGLAFSGYDSVRKLTNHLLEDDTIRMSLPNGPLNSGTPPTSAETAFRSFIRTFGLVERAMQSHFQAFGISGSQWGVLRNLHRAEEAGEGGLRLTDLSHRLLIRPPSVTGAVDRLEDAGLVARTAVPGDLRAKRVALTAEGRAVVERVLTVHGRQIAKVMAGLSTDEQHELNRLLTRLGENLQLSARPGDSASRGTGPQAGLTSESAPRAEDRQSRKVLP
jgi:DNA-binding MarR family transcriptional regulator